MRNIEKNRPRAEGEKEESPVRLQDKVKKTKKVESPTKVSRPDDDSKLPKIKTDLLGISKGAQQEGSSSSREHKKIIL